MEFYVMIKEAIERSGLKAAQVARRSGVPTYTINRICKGKRRTTAVHNAIALCKVLKIPCEQLMQIDIGELDDIGE